MTPTELKSIRLALGLNQRELGDALGVHEQTISRWESGKTEIPRTVELAIEHLKEKACNEN